MQNITFDQWIQHTKFGSKCDRDSVEMIHFIEIYDRIKYGQFLNSMSEHPPVSIQVRFINKLKGLKLNDGFIDVCEV
jgi:hypothetical protein